MVEWSMPNARDIGTKCILLVNRIKVSPDFYSFRSILFTQYFTIQFNMIWILMTVFHLLLFSFVSLFFFFLLFHSLVLWQRWFPIGTFRFDESNGRWWIDIFHQLWQSESTRYCECWSETFQSLSESPSNMNSMIECIFPFRFVDSMQMWCRHRIRM